MTLISHLHILTQKNPKKKQIFPHESAVDYLLMLKLNNVKKSLSLEIVSGKLFFIDLFICST